MKQILLTVIAGLFLVGCGPSTKLTSSWVMQEEEPKSFETLAVAALTKVPANREIVERAVALELRKKGITAIGTAGIFPFADKMDQLKDMGMDLSREMIEEKVREKLKAEKVDALMIISLMDKEKETEQRGGNFGVSMGYPISTYPYYGYSPYGYYSYAYSTVYSPSYYVETTTYIIETNLYDMSTENLIWSGVTETKDPDSVTKEAAIYGAIITEQLLEDGALK